MKVNFFFEYSTLVVLGNLPVERAKDAVLFAVVWREPGVIIRRVLFAAGWREPGIVCYHI